MLIYHPAYDVNHCVFRMLLIAELSINKRISWDAFRLVDFFFLFPHLLKTVKPWPNELRAYKSLVNRISDPFESIPNPRRILFDIEEIQNVAVLHLMSKGLIDLDAFEKRVILRTDTDVPDELLNEILGHVEINAELTKLIINELPQAAFFGEKGLKARSGLMEYRYDANAEASANR